MKHLSNRKHCHSEYHLTTEQPVPAVFDVSSGIYMSTQVRYANLILNMLDSWKQTAFQTSQSAQAAFI